MNTKQELYVRQDVGKGDPLILLHGIFGDGTQWRTIAQLLSKDYRVIVLDVLGHGKSPRSQTAKYSPTEQVAALRNSLVRIKATKNLTVVGYSMGGAVALSYAASYPNDIAQLHLISTPFYLQPEQMIKTHYASSLLITKISTFIFTISEKLLHPKGLLTNVVHYADGSDKFHDMIGATDNKLDSYVIKQSIKELIHEFDFYEYLSKVTAPVTFYTGKKDLFIVQGQLYALKQANPNMEIQRLDIIKVDHMLVQNLPKEMVKYITDKNQKYLHIGKDLGHGEVVVMLHGIESSSNYWDNIAPSIAENHRVICIDLLGFGKSPKPLNIAYNLSDQVTWLNNTLSFLGLNKISLVGHSLGSIVALAFAQKYPNKVKELILFSPVLIPPDQSNSKRFLLNKIKLIDTISDTSLLYSHTAKAIGGKRLQKYIPSMRTINNAVKNQDISLLISTKKSISTKILYGSNDQLIDEDYITNIAKTHKSIKVTKLTGKNHNFPMYYPNIAIKAIDGQKTHIHTARPSSKLPRSFVKQLVILAAPILMLKGILYIVIGLLLFTKYAPWVLTIGLIYFIVNKSIKLIKGAFSLRNEGLSYLGYLFLSGFILLASYGLFKHTAITEKIAVFTICTIVFLTGIIRLTVALFWTKDRHLKNSLLLSGLGMFILSTAAFFGSIKSIYIIIYSLAIILIIMGLQFGLYSVIALFMAFVRGFNKH